uniref:Retrotransposon gag domain-containing protein n=1 Tax=Vitis vinifera TaxID=29760 RepID=A5C8X9_VITVI|nr:hypothetical protein VITISV_001292 [Vitis vinifera]
MPKRSISYKTESKIVKNEFCTLTKCSQALRTEERKFRNLAKSLISCKLLKGNPRLRIILNGQYLLCMPYWIRDSGGKLVKIENPHETELEFCLNIMEATPKDQHSQHAQEDNFNAFRSMRDCMHPPRMSAPSSKENEKFHECWERYMEVINACPHHGFDIWLLVSYFYDGMSSSMKQLLEMMCGGDFMSKNPEEAMDFLSYVAGVSRGWDEPNAREAGMYNLNEDIDMKAKVAAMARRLEELEIKKIREVQAVSETPVQAMSCSICQSFEHLVEECPMILAVIHEVEAQEGESSHVREVKAVITLRSGKEVDLPTTKPEHEPEREAEEEKKEEFQGKRPGNSTKKKDHDSTMNEELERTISKEDMMKNHMSPPFP